MKVIWNGKTIADSENTIVIEGNHYFPEETVNKDILEDSDQKTTCFWKGEAKYYNLVDDGKTENNAAWCYPTPMAGAIDRVKKDFSGYIAFYPNIVEIKA